MFTKSASVSGRYISRRFRQTVIDDLQRRHMAIMGTREDVGHELEQETAETKEECEWRRAGRG